jgi:peptidoglycan/xylan/chitin deacetylase (PgdA/CDA1 family)
VLPATMIALPFADSVKSGLLASGWYANRLERDTFPGVLTLCYHGIRASAAESDIPFANLHVLAETFEAQCQLIADSCQPIDLATFCQARSNGRALPDRPVLVTFDDGYRSVFELARPILRRHRIPAAVFVCSEPVQRQRLFWFDAVTRAIGTDAFAALRAEPGETWRIAADTHDTASSIAPHLAPMTQAQVRQLADEGFTIGVHTASHAALGKAPAEVQRHELQSCRSALESWTGGRVDALAYPFGTPGVDYTEETVAIAGDLGFTTGFTTRHGFARAAEPALERSRFIVLASVSAAEFAHRVTYAWPR